MDAASKSACVRTLGVAVLGALGGCAQVPGNPALVVQCTAPASGTRTGPALVGQSYGLAMTPMPLNSVQFGSPDLTNLLAVQAMFAERSPADTVQLTVRLVSCADRAASVRVRTSFLRANTAPSEPASAWRVVYLEPRATALYTESSTARDVASYLVEIAP